MTAATARRALPGLFLAILFAGNAVGATPGLAPVEVRAIPIPVFLPGSRQTRFGALEYLGGIELNSRDPEFGSWSGLDFGADGRIYSIADTGLWLSARLVEDAAGHLTGVTDTKLGATRIDGGRLPQKKDEADAEGLRIRHDAGGDTALVSFEQTPAVRVYSGPDFSAAAPTRIKLPPFVKDLRRNQGLEGMALPPPESPLAGSVVLIAERSLDADGNHRGFIVGGPQTGTFSLRRSDDFDVSDAAFLPDGDLLVLERKFSFAAGVAIRIRRIAGAAIRPGALLDGPVLLVADSHYQIDNMEGLAVRTTADGKTLVTLISDDNNSIFQRTLLLQFALATP
jgi:hypothetical protein